MAAIMPDDLLSYTVTLWHIYRQELLFFISILFLFLQFYQLRRRRRQQQQQLPCDDKLALQKRDVTANQVSIDRSRQYSKAVLPSPARKQGPKRISGKKGVATESQAFLEVQPIVFYFSVGGSTRARAQSLAEDLSCTFSKDIQCHDLAEIDYEDYFISPPTTSKSLLYLFLIPSYDIDTELVNFLSNLEEIHHDFRIDTAPLSQLAGYSVLGFGDSQEWPERQGFCSQAVAVDQWMSKLTAGRRAFPLGAVDVRQAVDERIAEWLRGVKDITKDLVEGRGLGEGVVGSGDAYESGDEDPAPKRARLADLEDIRAPIPVDFTTTGPKAMVPVDSPTYKSLTKQGYSIVGSHSGVKICRWTKSALRGRGSCYKFSFYGIASHRCMEATPSLSCSNKCVFCWRHGTNPVGTTWRWQVDPPDLIFEGIKKEHYKKIKMLRGVPGVRAERFEEGMKIRHCALSLVGEPIFYPHINELLAMLHGEHISSFLVCNAQHPDQLASLGPVTQLYVSIDASNKESLRRIDRPLHRDYWERFIRCMDILKAKRDTHRTVFRLTLVKGFNIEDEAEGYADLVERARPSFVEVKGVTYCGTSTAAGAGLTMQNVPFYEEVTAFVLALEAALKRRGLDYGIGAEHAHSCCILMADRRYFIKGRWHTTIDYDKFFALLESGKAFGPQDYIGAPTAEWALWGNGGFDPRDERVDRKGRLKVV